MRKLLERLRLWLIRKLGGFTEQYHQTIRPINANVRYEILQVSTFINNEIRMGLDRRKVLEYARAQLAIRLANELVASDAVIVESREDLFRDELELRARVFVLEGKGSSLYLNRPLREVGL